MIGEKSFGPAFDAIVHIFVIVQFIRKNIWLILGAYILGAGLVCLAGEVGHSIDQKLWAEESKYYEGTTKQNWGESLRRCVKMVKGKPTVELECVFADLEKRGKR